MHLNNNAWTCNKLLILYVCVVCVCSMFVTLACSLLMHVCVCVGASHETAEGGFAEGEGDFREGGSQGLCSGETSDVISYLESTPL